MFWFWCLKGWILCVPMLDQLSQPGAGRFSQQWTLPLGSTNVPHRCLLADIPGARIPTLHPATTIAWISTSLGGNEQWPSGCSVWLCRAAPGELWLHGQCLANGPAFHVSERRVPGVTSSLEAGIRLARNATRSIVPRLALVP